VDCGASSLGTREGGIAFRRSVHRISCLSGPVLVEKSLNCRKAIQSTADCTYLSALLCSEVWQRWNRTSLSALLKTYLPDMAIRIAIVAPNNNKCEFVVLNNSGSQSSTRRRTLGPGQWTNHLGLCAMNSARLPTSKAVDQHNTSTSLPSITTQSRPCLHAPVSVSSSNFARLSAGDQSTHNKPSSAGPINQQQRPMSTHQHQRRASSRN